tara:strand:- start:136 stop:672 length:537 start_codon:yes stop_codon:yes gene_type:complete
MKRLSIKKQKKIKLSELIWEDYVYSNPKEFIGEPLQKYSRQKISKSGRSDLIFKDKDKKILIVELQCDALDKDHMRRAMDYKDDLIDDGIDEKNIRVMLLCNKIDEDKRYYIERHKLELKVVSELKVRQIIRKIDPRVEFTELDEETNHYHDEEELKEWKEKEKIKTSGNLNSVRVIL